MLSGKGMVAAAAAQAAADHVAAEAVTAARADADRQAVQAEADRAAAAAEEQSQQQAPRAVVQAPTSTNYANCDAVRAAGAAPIHRGDPGYAPKLDRDNDGVGCEN